MPDADSVAALAFLDYELDAMTLALVYYLVFKGAVSKSN